MPSVIRETSEGVSQSILSFAAVTDRNAHCAGKPKSIRETFDEVFQSIPYCIQLAGGPYIETKAACVKAFRPPSDQRPMATPKPS